MPTLEGRTIALLESRKVDELAALVRRLGGTPICAPAVREVPRLDDFDAFIGGLTTGRCSLAIFLTGVGATMLLQEAERRGRLSEAVEALRHMRLACRGPKPLAALRRYGLHASVTTRKPHTTHELLEALAPVDLRNHGLLLVHYGERNAAVADALRSRGARVDEVCAYEWALPDDIAPIQRIVRALIAERVDAVLFTSQVQCRHLFQVAGEMTLAADLALSLNRDVLVGAVGPVCAEALRALGVAPDVLPASPNSVSLVAAIADYFELTQTL